MNVYNRDYLGYRSVCLRSYLVMIIYSYRTLFYVTKLSFERISTSTFVEMKFYEFYILFLLLGKRKTIIFNNNWQWTNQSDDDFLSILSFEILKPKGRPNQVLILIL